MDHIYYNGILYSQEIGEMRGDERLPFSSPQPKKKMMKKKKTYVLVEKALVVRIA
jgi:hypothetical protein